MVQFGAYGDLEALDRQEQFLVDMLSLAKRTGWTLEYVQSLDLERYWRIRAILDGLDRAMAVVRKNPKAFGL